MEKMSTKWFLLCTVLTSVVLLTNAQISFSTSWGSGKRAVYNEPLALDTTCMSRTEPEVLMDLVKAIQKETERVVECLLESKNIKQRQRTINYS